MTKRDYVAIASAVKSATNNGQINLEDLIFELCEVLHNDNERFDRARFVEACTDMRPYVSDLSIKWQN